MKLRLVVAASFVLLLVSGVSFGDEVGDFGSAGGWHDSSSPRVIGEGESATYYTPHHEVLGGGHNSHFLAQTGDAHHFAWFGTTPASPGPIIINYDFRSQGGFANLITAGQQARVIDALNGFSAATNGRLQFVQDTVTASANIVNIGTGDLAALGSTSAPGGILGLGGGSFDHGGGHLISNAVAWQDFAETWDEELGNGNPAGTFDYFTVAAQEIGHAIGFGHITGDGIMNGAYTGERTTFSGEDVEHIQSVYGASAIPEPGSAFLLMAGFAGLMIRRRRAS